MDLVIGYYSLHQSLCVGLAESTRAMAREFALVQNCHTVGELLRVGPILTEISLPAEVEELTEMDPATPWSWYDDGHGVQDGDWPGMPTSVALDDLPDAALQALLELDGVRVVTTIFNGDYLEMDQQLQDVVVATLQAQGHTVTYDHDAFDWGQS